MIGMPPLPVRQDKNFRPLLANHARHLQAIFPGILHPSIRDIERSTPRDFQDPRRFFRFASPIFGRASRAHFPLCQIEDAGAISAVGHFEEGAAAGLFHIIAVRGESKNIECHHGETSSTSSSSLAFRQVYLISGPRIWKNRSQMLASSLSERTTNEERRTTSAPMYSSDWQEQTPART